MGSRNSRCIHYYVRIFIQLPDIIFKMDLYPFTDQFIRKRRRCFIITCHFYTAVIKIPRQRAHADATDAGKIN